MILLLSVSQVARITGVSHLHLVRFLNEKEIRDVSAVRVGKHLTRSLT
jgi:hypothetical protein